MEFYHFQNEYYFNKKCIIDMDIVNDVRCSDKNTIMHVDNESVNMSHVESVN